MTEKCVSSERKKQAGGCPPGESREKEGPLKPMNTENTRDGIRLGLVTKTSPKSRVDPEGTSPGRTRGYPNSDLHVPSPGTRHFWGGYKLLFLAGTLILHKIICTYGGYIRT